LAEDHGSGGDDESDCETDDVFTKIADEVIVSVFEMLKRLVYEIKNGIK
jgi:hypothetical protein